MTYFFQRRDRTAPCSMTRINNACVANVSERVGTAYSAQPTSPTEALATLT